MVWIAGSVSLVVVVLEIITLVDLFKHRLGIKTWQLIAWALFILIVPIVGMVSYLLWRISRSDALVESMEFDAKYSKGDKQLPPRL